MSAQPAPSCQKCHATITMEQIQKKQAGTVKGVWLCPPCVENLKKQVAMSQSGLLNLPTTAAAPAVDAALAGTATMEPPARVAVAEPAMNAANGNDSTMSEPNEEPKGPRVEGGSAIKTLGARGAGAGEFKFRRPLAPQDQGATRVHTFHARMSGSALQNLDYSINEWLDHHPDIYIKDVVASVGVFEAKMSSEQHLVLSIFY